MNGGGEQTVEGKNIILAVGSEVTPLPPCLSTTTAEDCRLHWRPGYRRDPREDGCDWGGVIGLEMGSVWGLALGDRRGVHGLYCRCHGLWGVEHYQKILKKQGMKFMMNTKVTKVRLLTLV